MVNVMLIDDHPVVRAGLRAILNTFSDVEVVMEGSTGADVDKLFTADAPQVDAVVCDIQMPDVDGIAATKRVVDAGGPPVLILTTYDTQADILAAVEAGAMGYLLKDSSIDEVAQAIRVVSDGQSLISPSMAIKLLDEFKQMSRSDRQQVPTPRLTERELEVLKLVAQGLNNREIAKRLFISENTVKNHIRNILEKLHLHSPRRLAKTTRYPR